MKNKVLTVILVLSLGLNLGVVATFSRHWLIRRDFKKGPGENNWFKKKIKKELNLTNTQVEFMEQDRKNINQEIKSAREELKRKRAELFALLDTDPVDSVKVDKLIDAISSLQAKIEKTIVGHLVTMKKNLTPEQQRKFKAIMPRGFMTPPPDQPGKERHEGPPEP
ncbi:MAG: Spy/CpxP family protein refolding chaperone [bacterium]|nr:Spy/CpxP family protein refolding chaperone [bacterium]MDD5755661.1 Spy/CpxP family protein refolding chaperone [bacterium]